MNLCRHDCAPEAAKHDALLKLVDRILAAKRADPAACLSPGDGRQADTSVWERGIAA